MLDKLGMISGLVLLFWLAPLQTALAKDSAFPNGARPPNIVLILIDDLSHYGMTAYGSSILRSNSGLFEDTLYSTPNIDALARSGLRLDRAYAYPLCENTRIALLTGRGNERNFLAPKSQHHSDVMISDIFQRAGYATGIFGKWKQSRGTPSIPAVDYLAEFGWDEFTAFDVAMEGGRYLEPDIVRNGDSIHHSDMPGIDPETGRRPYGPDIFNRDAIAFIERNRDRPFFLYYPMVLVHDEHQPTPATRPGESFDHFDTAKVGPTNIAGDDPAYIVDMIEYADMLIGRLVDRIEQLGLREDTLIILLGDNGTKEIFSHVLPDGSVYPGGKGRSADHGTHVGLILSQPGTIPASNDSIRSYDGLTFVTDILPTALEASRIDVPPNTTIDGLSFWKQAIGASTLEPRDHINYWYIGNGNYADVWAPIREHAVFDREFKRYAPNVSFDGGRFFDLRSDPFELSGDRHVVLKWGMRRYSGLTPAAIDTQQESAFERLGALLEYYREVPVESLAIETRPGPFAVGETRQLRRLVFPKRATRTGVIWTSSAPHIASVDKFGMVTAHLPGQAEIQIYSWDDAQPSANGRAPEFLKTGKSASMTVEVSD